MVDSFGQPTRGGPLAWGLGGELATPHHKNTVCFEMLHRVSDLGRFYRMTQEMENGHERWNTEC